MRDRKIIDDLIAAIEKKWAIHASKGDTWKSMSDQECMDKLDEELDELTVDVISKKWGLAILEAADVSICAAFLAAGDKRNNIKNFPELYLVSNKEVSL